MRNLKRVLALVMALVMALSLMVMGVSAASYTDADQIDADYSEAFEVLTNIGVIKGQDNGNGIVAAPKAILTRAEASTLVYRLLTGDVTDAQKKNYDFSSFDDVKEGEWWTGYITYAANGGYVVGDGNGKFRPEDEVTGIQVLTIMLRAIGYGQNGEYVGAGWKDNVLTDAKELGIIGSISTKDLDKGASRELVAQLLFNAITTPKMVTYSALLGYRTDRDATTLGGKTFGLEKVEGVLTANEKADLYDTDTLAAGKSKLDDKTTYNLATDETLLGENITFWAYGLKGVKTAVTAPKSLATVTDWSNTNLSAAQKKSINDAITKDTEIYYNYDPVAEGDSYIFGNGIKFKAVDNDGDGEYEYILNEESTFTTVKYVSTSGVVTLANFTSEKGQDYYTGIAADDKVLVISYDGNTHIKKASYVTGIVSGVKETAVTANDTAIINDEQYKVSKLESVANPPIYDFDTVRDTYQPGADWNGKTYNYYQDEYGNIIAYAEAGELETAYGLILDYDIYKSGAFEGDLTWRPTNGINFGDLYVKYLTVENKVQTAKVDADFAKYFGDENYDGSDYYVEWNILPGDVVSYRIDEDGEFVLAYTYDPVDDPYATVKIDGKTDIATVTYSDDSKETYSVGSDLVVFYYITSGQERSLLSNLLGASTPVYGVLTGADAIADLAAAEELYQFDARTGADNHLSENGYVTMLNVRAHINTFVDYCYVPSWKAVSSYKINGEYVWEYKAIGSDGAPITVVTDHPYDTDEDRPVWAYHTLNVNGVQVNELLPVESNGAWVEYGDLHASANGKYFYIYDTDGWTSDALYGAPTMYVDVATGEAAELSEKYCSTGYIVVESVGGKDTVKAAFITETVADEPLYVDTTVSLLGGAGQEKHLPIGFEFNEKLLAPGKYTVKINGDYVTTDGEDLAKDKSNLKIYEVKKVGDNYTTNLKVTAAWDKAKVEITAYNPVQTKFDNGIVTNVVVNNVNLGAPKYAYTVLADAIAGAENAALADQLLNSATSDITVQYNELAGLTGLSVAAYRNAPTSITAPESEAGTLEDASLIVGDYIVITEVYNGVTYYMAYIVK